MKKDAVEKFRDRRDRAVMILAGSLAGFGWTVALLYAVRGTC